MSWAIKITIKMTNIYFLRIGKYQKRKKKRARERKKKYKKTSQEIKGVIHPISEAEKEEMLPKKVHDIFYMLFHCKDRECFF